MAIVPTPTNAVAHSHARVGANYLWDGSPLGMREQVGVVCHSNRPPTRPE